MTIENHHLLWIFPLNTMIFHSYVKSPEGISKTLQFLVLPFVGPSNQQSHACADQPGGHEPVTEMLATGRSPGAHPPWDDSHSAPSNSHVPCVSVAIPIDRNILVTENP